MSLIPKDTLLSNFFKNLKGTTPVTASDISGKVLVDLQKISDAQVIKETNLDVLVPAVDGQKKLTLSATPDFIFTPLLLVNGQAQDPKSDYSIIGNILNWISSDFNISPNDKILLHYSS